MTHLGLLATRLRDGIIWALPLVAIAALVALLATFAIVSLSVLDQRDAQEETLREVKEATLINRRLIERGNPCLPDAPTSEACQLEADRDRRLAEALAAVQAQHDEQARQVDDAVNRLIELQERQHGVDPNAGSSPRPPSRTTPRITAQPSTPTAGVPEPPSITAPAPEPATTPTTCPTAGKSGRCRK